MIRLVVKALALVAAGALRAGAQGLAPVVERLIPVIRADCLRHTDAYLAHKNFAGLAPSVLREMRLQIGGGCASTSAGVLKTVDSLVLDRRVTPDQVSRCLAAAQAAVYDYATAFLSGVLFCCVMAQAQAASASR